MNIRLFTAAGILFASTALFAADRNFDRTLHVTGAPDVTVKTGAGFIHIHAGTDGQVHIAGHVHASRGFFDGDMESKVQQIANNPPIAQTGNTIVIGQQNHGFDDLFRNVSIDYDVTMPKATVITATTGSGDIELQDVGTNLRAQTGSGNIRARGIHGASTLGTGSGDIELIQAASGDVRVETGSGSIRLAGVDGGLRANTGSGDIEAAGNVAADWRLTSGSGSVHLNLGPKAHFNLNASTGSGGVHLEQPLLVQGSVSNHHVTGSVNGGGPSVRVETGSGSVEIR